jgi:hypothetical protein
MSEPIAKAGTPPSDEPMKKKKGDGALPGTPRDIAGGDITLNVSGHVGD